MASIADIADRRVRDKIIEHRDCWLWLGAKNSNGYGHFVRRKNGKQKKVYAHRYVYAELVGPIPRGHEVHHSCYNRWCCNPSHLSTVTHRANCAPHGK